MALRWRKQPSETGLRRIAQGPRGFELRDGQTIMAHVSPSTTGPHSYTIVGWYWYGDGQNTYNHPCKTAEEAKAEVIDYFKKKKKEAK